MSNKINEVNSNFIYDSNLVTYLVTYLVLI